MSDAEEISNLREMLETLSPSERERFATLAAWMLEHPEDFPVFHVAPATPNELLPGGSKRAPTIEQAIAAAGESD